MSFYSFAISFSATCILQLIWYMANILIWSLIVLATRYHIFTSLFRSDRPDNYSSAQCGVRPRRTPYHIDHPAWGTKPRPSGQHSTEYPILTARLTRFYIETNKAGACNLSSRVYPVQVQIRHACHLGVMCLTSDRWWFSILATLDILHTQTNVSQ